MYLPVESGIEKRNIFVFSKFSISLHILYPCKPPKVCIYSARASDKPNSLIGSETTGFQHREHFFSNHDFAP